MKLCLICQKNEAKIKYCSTKCAYEAMEIKAKSRKNISMNRDTKIILLGTLALAIMIVINVVLVRKAVSVTIEKSCSTYQPSCGDFEYYVPETNKCVPFRNYEQEARYKGLIN